MENNKETQERTGDTIITSVSVTKFFDKLIKVNHISPTEAFRRGVALTLCEMGINPYDNPLNRKRLDKADKFLDEIKKIEELKARLSLAVELLDKLNKI